MSGKRGRPARFDRQDALERAMTLFWAKGYEGTTLDDLQAAMGGVKPASFYHAFGSKEAVFKEAVALYLSTVGAAPVRALEEATTARDGVAAMLRTAALSFSQPGPAQGCLLMLGALHCAPANQGVADELKAVRLRAREPIEARLRRAQAEGDLSPDADLSRIVGFYVTMIQGLALRAGDGTPREDLLAAAEDAMAAWPALVG